MNNQTAGLKKPFILQECAGRLEILNTDDPQSGTVYVDFTDKTRTFRRLFGGGRKQAIARAVGLKHGAQPYVVDATAGLGKDAFVLASLGCRVHMIERNPAIAALLEDGLKRAKSDPQIGDWIAERMSSEAGDSCFIVGNLNPRPEVIYLDPMFPLKKKSALNKKDMRIFKEIIGFDVDAGNLLRAAILTASDRVVVKRPSYADVLGGIRPDSSIKTAKHRFDIYLSSTDRHV